MAHRRLWGSVLAGLILALLGVAGYFAVQSAGSARTPPPTPQNRATTGASSLAQLLRQRQMPPYDPIAVVSGLRNGLEIPRIVHASPVAYVLGDQRRFWIGDVGSPGSYQITATLWLQTEHVQMWVDEDAVVDRAALLSSAQAFDAVIYPNAHRYFGSEWNPGIDGDPRVVILNAFLRGAAGYFHSVHEYPREVYPHSNECEMFVMDLGAMSPGTVSYEAILAHEFQHMILWHQDSNEQSWVSEGLSELAEELMGYGASEVMVRAYAQNPDLQLTDWPPPSEEVSSHYGASHLLMHYFLQRFGPDALRDLVQEPADGSVGFDAVLSRLRPGLTFDALFADWLVANAVDDSEWEDGRYGYRSLQMRVEPHQTVSVLPFQYEGEVSQYGADYIALSASGPGAQGSAKLRINFAGASHTRLVPNDAVNGAYQWWSNRGDGGHAYLEHTFDLRHVISATLSFALWHDIEEGWDYAYVRASRDNGRTWQLLRSSHMSEHDPIEGALGPAYTGKSGLAQGQAGDATWVRDEIDLGPYCGGQVTVRFDYITDDAVNYAGLSLDDFRLDAIGWADDVERGEGDWRAEGFIRHNNELPQRYLLQWVTLAPALKVQTLATGDDGRGQWIIEGWGNEATRGLLIVSALAPVTTERANYLLRLEQVP